MVVRVVDIALRGVRIRAVGATNLTLGLYREGTRIRASGAVEEPALIAVVPGVGNDKSRGELYQLGVVRNSVLRIIAGALLVSVSGRGKAA